MSKPADLIVPALGESITEAVIGRWLVGVGEHVDADEPVVDLETDKITVQLPAPVSGALSERKFKEGDTVKVGDIVGLITEGAAKVVAKKEAAAPARVAAKPTPAKKVASAPSAKAPASTSVPERDEEGRVLSPSKRRAIRSGEEPSPSAAPSFGGSTNKGPREEIVPMSPLRKRIAERLVQAQHTSASLTTFNEIDMTNIMELRARYKESFIEQHGVKLGFMSFAVKACVASLKEFPGLNAEIREESIVYKKYYDIGIAVGTKKGLVVPVVRDCDRRSFADVEKGINELALKARDNKLALDDLMGGTFSITNGGVYGSMMSTPLLNFPQTAILGMHNIIPRPMAIGSDVKVRPMMYLALTYDHRVVDGKEAVQFLVGVKRRMEDPERLLFEV